MGAMTKRNALFLGAAVVLAIGVVSAFAMTRGDDSRTTSTAGGIDVGHIHGIGVDPADGQLYVGAHSGLFRVSPDGDVEPVGAARHDLMSFTVTGPGRFVASGHPEYGSDLPVHLGLVESSDGEGSWESVSLSGEADFHALEVAPDGRYWGADSVSGTLITSTDAETWTTVAQEPLLDLAIDPAGGDAVLATTGTGELKRFDAAGASAVVPDTPTLVLVDWPAPDQLVAVAPDGTVQVSTTSGETWTAAGQVPGQPSALEAAPDAWYVATDQGLFSSDDEGATWEPLFAYAH